MFFGKKLPVTWLVVGLGNPGDKYENTRHNAGFMAIDQLADRGDFPVQRLKFHALTHQATISGQGVLVMKPTTYMNLSGDAVAEAAAFYKVSEEHILVLCDDVSLPVGKLRIRTSGSAGGHNGLKSIIQRLGTDKFPRVKIGVGGKPHPDYDMADWVLGKFVGPDKTAMDEATLRAAQAVECYLKDGPQKAMNQFN
ncbi:aminoacyl-tRNA hydrolase [Pseudoflavonifractor sp. An176]|uniref:aminoacyl-tRNA hydrolase n=1 Tax=Pseudoflavonifractor sp. An176 TaxID=1965572 RepID=UPI000B3A2D9D|nr:aminoacyl-tRNA hydrolase [Pseudoflavonifractor sp. An176]OUP63892.1 aminoacyl-tRNA hydrolase [Pseudoflavonifractor sp. An176]